MERINIAELLKDCPKGMELDCVLFDNVKFEECTEDYINIRLDNGRLFILTKYGNCIEFPTSKCVIFPKGKTTWKGFHRPFKDGDIIFTHANCLKVGLGNTWISIFQEKRNGGVATYVDMTEDKTDYYDYIVGKGLLCMDEDIMRQRFATEEEKQKLFQAIKERGYKWNSEAKTLENLIEPKFKVGDRVRHISAYASGIVVKVTDKGYHIDYPKGEGVCYISFTLEKDYELAPNKFDINTLVPFESKVLVRHNRDNKWCGSFFSHIDEDFHSHCYRFVTTAGRSYPMCIPYEGNQHLLGKVGDCDEFYKTWG